MMKNGFLSKGSILLRCGDEISTLLCFTSVLMGKIVRVCVESPEHKSVNISSLSGSKMLIFGK